MVVAHEGKGRGEHLHGEDGCEEEGGGKGEPGEDKLGGLDARPRGDEPLVHDVDADDDEERAVVEVGQEVDEGDGEEKGGELQRGEGVALHARRDARADGEDALAEDDAACTRTPPVFVHLLVAKTLSSDTQGKAPVSRACECDGSV